MTVAARKAHGADTLPGTPAERRGSTPETVRMLREILAGQGLRESLSTDDEGFYFVAEDAAEVSIYYNASEQNRPAPPARARESEAGLLKCAQTLAQRGFTLTLFLSGRTSALFVRNG